MYLGIDLSGKEENETGTCVLDGDITARTVFKNETIIRQARKASVVAIDAPLTECEKAFRTAERELMEEFGPLLPLNTPGMKKLSRRARRIKDFLQEECEIIETYPRAVEKVLDIDKTIDDFRNEHEFDAYLCALTAKKYSEGKYKKYGERFKSIILPAKT